MKKSWVYVLSMVVLLAVAAAGCGQKKESAQSSGDGDATVLNFWTFQELHKGFMDDAVSTWNEKHPDKKIILKTDVYPYDEQHNKLLIALQSGTGAPDLADIEIGKFANYIKGSKPGLVELNDIVDPVKDNLIMGRMDNYAKDGKYYGVDYHVGAEVMYYNKEILDQAGVDINKIVTWDDYIAAGKQVVAKTGKPMTTIETTEHWSVYPLMNMQGSDVLDKDGNSSFDNATNIKTLQMLKDMLYKDKIAVPAPGGYHHSEEYWAWMNKGNAASVWMPMWYMGRFVQYMPELKGKIVIRPMPVFAGGKRSVGMGGTATVITTQSKHAELVKQFLAEAKLSKEGSIKTWTLLGFDPIRKDAWSDPAMSAPNKYTDYFGTDIFSTLQSVVADIGQLNVGAKYPAAISLLQKNVCFRVLKEQSQSPEEALKAAGEDLKAQ
ncbi:arabinosaccharide transport system substrate-binding protein [Propionispira arboris]|uniref:Arabinosaccharide transport system substrate-binding protein n=1 Tax=Propionispira arboris TaxID=84035 RepID=A0A1H6TU65_9FIRM|nr:extracellular solute-binding protein [Propionispira arboris]SEI80767.1 arabinosaccharide transport system substrate-binding protein [Propionispira arboris]